jgi:hypothetical protein
VDSRDFWTADSDSFEVGTCRVEEEFLKVFGAPLATTTARDRYSTASSTKDCYIHSSTWAATTARCRRTRDLTRFEHNTIALSYVATKTDSLTHCTTASKHLHPVNRYPEDFALERAEKLEAGSRKRLSYI